MNAHAGRSGLKPIRKAHSPGQVRWQAVAPVPRKETPYPANPVTDCCGRRRKVQYSQGADFGSPPLKNQRAETKGETAEPRESCLIPENPPTKLTKLRRRIQNMPQLGAHDASENSHGDHPHGVCVDFRSLEGPIQYDRSSDRSQPEHQSEGWNVEAQNVQIRKHASSSIDVALLPLVAGNRLTRFSQGLAVLARQFGDTIPMSKIAQGLEVLYTRQQISERVAEMGAQITRDLNGEKVVMVGVLKGAALFLSDLARAIEGDATFDFVAVSSYGKGQRSSGAVKLIKDLDEPIEGKNVLIVEDILDTGLTLSYLRKVFLQHRPKTLRIAALLDKPSRRIEKIEADYVGFSIPNLFVIGYGMDYAERYRNLADICLMAPDHPE